MKYMHDHTKCSGGVRQLEPGEEGQLVIRYEQKRGKTGSSFLRNAYWSWWVGQHFMEWQIQYFDRMFDRDNR